MFKIPLYEPYLNGNEWNYIKECLDTNWVSSSGSYVEKFEQEIIKFTGSKYAVSCINGTAALQIALKIAGVLPGDEVLVPTLTFIAPVNAVSYNGAIPVFFDSDNYFNIDSKNINSFIYNHTKMIDGYTYNKYTKRRITAIIPVHIWGNSCCMEPIRDICEKRNIKIIEDASESLGTFYHSGDIVEKHTGTIGNLGCISFNGNKIITAGGGGMILTDSKKIAKKAKYLTTQAKDDSLKYIHNEIGYNYRLTNIQAALGLAQLEQLPTFLDKKKKIHIEYQKIIETIEGLEILKSPKYSISNFWLNILRIDKKYFKKNINQIVKLMEKKNIELRYVWKLNHLQKPYGHCQSYEIANAIEISNNSLCLPSSVSLESSSIYKIAEILGNI